MAYHSEGALSIINEDGNSVFYKVDIYGCRLTLSNSEGKWDYITDKPAIICKKLEQEINEMSEILKQKRYELKRLQRIKI